MDLSEYTDFFLGLIENSPFSKWLRAADYVFSGLITVHVVGAGLIAAVSVGMSLQLLGAVPGVPAKAMNKYIPFLWTGLSLSVPSGLLLLISYPTKELTNPLFYVKLIVIVLALVVVRDIRELAFNGGVANAVDRSARAKRLAIALLVLWAFVIGAGRFLAYTYTRLMLDF